MSEVVLITGSGMIAQDLAEKLEKNNFSVRFLCRTRKNPNYYTWNLKEGTIEEGALKNVNHIIHLAGAGIADKRWSNKRKEELISSRVDSSRLILNTLSSNNIKIDSFISASAVGFYGTETIGDIYNEDSRKGNDFLSDVCLKWEQVADDFKTKNISSRVVKIRIGVVLSNKGGALRKMVNPIKFYIGSALGSGNQFIPWIHIDDLCEIFIFSIKNKNSTGIFNAVAPESITNKNFTKATARVIKKPLVFPNIPSVILKLIFGEMSIILLKGSRISSKKIMDEGFTFKYKTILSTLENLLK